VNDVATVYYGADGFGHAGTGDGQPKRATLRLAKAVPLCYTHTCHNNLNVT
jgi:hypothetical protein